MDYSEFRNREWFKGHLQFPPIELLFWSNDRARNIWINLGYFLERETDGKIQIIRK